MTTDHWLRIQKSKSGELPLLVTAPHPGEWIPPEASHLESLAPSILLTDVDRFVDELYDFVPSLGGTLITTRTHRYAVDLNRIPEDVDSDSVQGAKLPPGTHAKGFHWTMTTLGQKLMPKPLTMSQHEQLTRSYYQPFMDSVYSELNRIKKKFGMAFHIDVHSMPSLGSSLHPDPGKKRKDIVLGDHEGASCTHEWMKSVWKAYQSAQFDVTLNDPYKGGRLSGLTGKNDSLTEAIQVELNRRLYMNETTKEKNQNFQNTKSKLKSAFSEIVVNIQSRLDS